MLGNAMNKLREEGRGEMSQFFYVFDREFFNVISTEKILKKNLATILKTSSSDYSHSKSTRRNFSFLV